MPKEHEFKVALSREALKYYDKVSTSAERLHKCFAGLELEPVKGANIRLLKEMSGKYRYRVGNLRVIYQV